MSSYSACLGFLISILPVIAGAIAYGGSVGTAEAYAKGS
jgi:hypothetical protein